MKKSQVSSGSSNFIQILILVLAPIVAASSFDVFCNAGRSCPENTTENPSDLACAGTIANPGTA